jgi:hypothetical protein
MALPALRNVDGGPIKHQGETLFYLRDAEGFVPEPLVLSPAAYFIASCLDGSRDLVDIQHLFARMSHGTLIMSDDILKVVNQLDESGFLVSDKFLAIRDQVVAQFTQSPARAAYGAGNSYPKDPDELRKFLDGCFTREGGPGATLGTSPGKGKPVRCVIAPHIDFQRGGHIYAHGYLRMYQREKPDVAFVFGVAHGGGSVPFILTRKHFETPLGVMRTDQEIVDRIAAACPWDPYEGEILHRAEHSIELQVVMLARLYGTALRIVPILCGQLVPDPAQEHPDDAEGVASFLATCREVAASPENRVAVIAGADLAHVGRRFGDPFDISPAIVRKVEHRDREDLAFVTAADPSGFYRSVMKDGNVRRICGHGCIYAALKTVQGMVRRGEILDYGYAPDPAGGIVSFMSAVLS